MIRINLLPVRQTRKLESVRRELVLAGFFGIVVVGGCLAVWALLQIRLASVSGDNDRLQAEIDRLAADVKKVDEMEKARAELQTKLEVIAKLRLEKVGPVHMLDEIAVATPEKLTLSALEDIGSGKIRITGYSVSNEVISQFLRALEASEYFDAVYLEDIQAVKQSSQAGKKSAMQGISLKEFKLTAKLITPKAEAAAEEAAPAPGGAAPAGGAPAAPAGAAATPEEKAAEMAKPAVEAAAGGGH